MEIKGITQRNAQALTLTCRADGLSSRSGLFHHRILRLRSHFLGTTAEPENTLPSRTQCLLNCTPFILCHNLVLRWGLLAVSRWRAAVLSILTGVSLTLRVVLTVRTVLALRWHSLLILRLLLLGLPLLLLPRR